MRTDAEALRDLDALLNAPDKADNDQLVAHAKKTIERLTLLADLFCEACDEDREDTLDISDEIEAAIKEHDQWRLGCHG